LHPNLKTLEES